MTQAPFQPQQPPQPVRGHMAFFPFKTKDGQPPKPGSPTMTGNIQFTHQQIADLYSWSLTQGPDEYGKVKVNASLWDTLSNDGAHRYLKGNIKFGDDTARLQQAAVQQQQASAAVQQQVYPGTAPFQGAQPQQPQQPQWNQQPPQAPMQAPVPQAPMPSGQPLPAWTTDQAWQRQQQTSNMPNSSAAQQQPSSIGLGTIPQRPSVTQQGTAPMTPSPLSPAPLQPLNPSMAAPNPNQTPMGPTNDNYPPF